MFWDKIAGFYDLFETVYNGSVYRALGQKVAAEIGPDDLVLECACGTGAISRDIAKNCRKLLATDASAEMLKRAAKKCRGCGNVTIRRMDMAHIRCGDNRFDRVVAGNVIHLLEEPRAALAELVRVCRPGGKIVIPTYINAFSGVNQKAVRLLEALGVDFRRQFDMDSYRQFFADAGYRHVDYEVIDGRMPCALAVIAKDFV